MARSRNRNHGREHDPLEYTRKKRKQKAFKDRPAFSGPAHRKEHKINPLKHRIRDLKRLLSKVEDMPADVRLAHERELAHLQRDLEVEQEEVQKSEAKKNMYACYQKYKMVRFFDRQKAERRLKKATKAYQSPHAASDRERLLRERHLAEVDFNYTYYFPLGKPYSSLYPSKKSEHGQKQVVNDDDDDDDVDNRMKGDLEIWQQVEQAMEMGKYALERLRKGAHIKDKTQKEEAKQHRQGKDKSAAARTNEHIGRRAVDEEGNEEGDNNEEDEDVENGTGFFE